MPLKITDTSEEPALNLTPMVDIVFLLIIFFMVGTQFTKAERHFDVQLPTVSDAQPLTSLPDEIVINVLGDERVLIHDKELTLAELETTLRKARKDYPDQSVVVRGSAPDPYQQVMDVLAACHRAKISHISLANRIQEAP